MTRKRRLGGEEDMALRRRSYRSGFKRRKGGTVFGKRRKRG
jgi:hypothetical protein